MYIPGFEAQNMSRGLRRLGFSSYVAYIHSGSWAHTRRRFRRDSCEICGRHTALVLHHMTYANLGAELAQDVCTLCSGCHGKAHAHAAGGGSLYPPAVVKARSASEAQERLISALSVTCPTCGARAGEPCLTRGQVRTREHQARRQLDDRVRKAQSGARRQRKVRRRARSRKMTVRYAEAIDVAREAEFPLETLHQLRPQDDPPSIS